MYFINFSCRTMLEKMYYKWIEQEKLADTPLNVIAFLYTRNLLNEDKIKQLWEKYRELKRLERRRI